MTEPRENPKAVAAQKEAKIPMEVMTPTMLLALAAALIDGARKYGPWNWRDDRIRSSTYIAAMLRHLVLLWAGEWACKKSGLSHASHIAATALIMHDAEAADTLIRDQAASPWAVATFEEMMAANEDDANAPQSGV